jgi:hypothetical protein
VVGVARVGGGLGRQPERELRELALVAAPNLLSPQPGALEARQLMDSERRLQIHHVVLEAALDHIIMLVALVSEALPRVLGHPV